VIPFASETADGMPKHSQLDAGVAHRVGLRAAVNWQAGLFLFKEDYKVESFSYDSLAGNAQDGYQRIRQTNDAWRVRRGELQVTGAEAARRPALHDRREEADRRGLREHRLRALRAGRQVHLAQLHAGRAGARRQPVGLAPRTRSSAGT
jgi:hypothetical protein